MNEYKPMLGDRLEFPEGMKAVVIYYSRFCFSVQFFEYESQGEQYYQICNAVNRKLYPADTWLFFSFDEIMHACYNQHKEDYRFYLIADFVSSMCKGYKTPVLITGKFNLTYR